MAIHIEEQTEMSKGFTKKLDESGIKMTFDLMQRYQYAYPIKSTVREILSNGIDSVAEKKMAKAILKGESKVEDYFVDIQGEVYKDSKWTPEYYDLKWLSAYDRVHITYRAGTNMNKDAVIITDHGVGLGGTRLEKYFSLGYSTKRLSKLPLGKFGLGAKAPLSIGEPFYTVESCYNGQLFRFNVYSYKVDSVVPKINLETGKENKHIVFSEGTDDAYIVYYEDTIKKNQFSVILTAKSHHKPQYVDAVKQQMLYFDEIDFKAIDNSGREEIIDYKAKILYEDDFIVLSDNSYYTAPHLLLNKVNYGFIDWNELEMEQRRGNIGIKVAPEDIEVSPSRESVLWTEKTKVKVLERYNKVVEIATHLIQEELGETDIVKWLKACYQISGHSRYSSGTLSRLANIVDLAAIKPAFILSPDIKFRYAEPFAGTFMKYIRPGQKTSKETGETKRIINRTVIDGLSEHYNKPFVLIKRDERASNRKDKYLLYLYPDGYVGIYEPLGTEEQIKDAGTELSEWFAGKKSEYTKLSLRRNTWDMLCASKEVLFYEKIEVPETFNGTNEEEDLIAKEKGEETAEEVVAHAQIAKQTAAERRKLTGKTIVHMMRTENNKVAVQEFNATLNRQTIKQVPAFYTFMKTEVPTTAINDWEEEGQEVYYGNDKDDELLHFAAILTRPAGQEINNPYRPYANTCSKWKELKWYRLNKDKLSTYGVNEYNAYNLQHFFDSNIKLIKVSQTNSRLYRDFKKIQEFFITIKGKTFTMSNLLIKWNTARVVKDKLAACAFLYNFEAFNTKYADMYKFVCGFVDKNWRDLESKGELYGLGDNTVKDLVAHLDKVQQFQNFVKTQQGDADAIAKLAGDLFGNKELQDGMAVDPEIIAMVDELYEFAVATGDMLNWIPSLTGYNTYSKPHTYDGHQQRNRNPLPNELEMEIRSYLEFKQVLDYGMKDEPSELLQHADSLDEVQQLQQA